MGNATSETPIDFRTAPDRYRHWKLSPEDGVAYLAMDVNEDGGLRPGYELKLNSYDLGVDIELDDAVQRLRFEHPEVARGDPSPRKDRIFCAGANIRMLGRLEPRLQGELLQVHQRDAATPSRTRREHRGQSYLRRSTASPRAAATSWRWPATGSCWPTTARRGVAARGAAARRAAGHRRPDAAGGQAPGAPRPRRLLLHDRGGHRASARVEWRLVDEVVPRSQAADEA